ncbi:MAG: HK97-gp10 family putative phage morphogenesis protein [Peptostreptococcaceae bacterium]
MKYKHIEGMDALMKSMKKLEKVPTRQISKGARRGANVILRQARENAPVKTRKLKKGIILRGERSRKRGKKVFQVTLKSADKFPEAVKITKDGTRYYYPSSQEYGFDTVDGGHIDGKYYLKKAMESKSNEASRVMIKEIGQEIDKALGEGKLS